MAQNQFHQPDEAAMERLLEEYSFQPTGIVLCLAWREGLTRGEICELTWDRVDFDARLLRLPDREVPLEEDVAETLQHWKIRCERFSPYVAVTDKLRKRLVPQSIPTLVRHALDSAGQTEVRLLDLRYDYVRRKLQTNDWPYVLRISGISVENWRGKLHWLQEASDAPLTEPMDAAESAERLWAIMQAKRDAPAGIALWLGSQAGLECEEIVQLTWEQVDLDANVIRLPDREVEIPMSVRWVLSDEKARRAPEDDPHVILTPNSRKPMDSARLGVVVRGELIRGVLEGYTMKDFRLDSAKDAERRAIIGHVAEHGSISRRETAALLKVSDGMAYRRLTALCEEGLLVRVNLKYYPADTAVRPEEQRAAICAYIGEQGPVRRERIAELLHIGQRHTSRILRRMVDDGELRLLHRSRQAALPERQER